MGVGVEDVIAVKILEYGIVPPVPNFKEIDPDLGPLNLSRGGRYPVQYAVHLAAGFGSQISMTLTRRIPGGLNRIDNQGAYQYWLDAVSGIDNAELEVEKRVLRIKATGQPGRAPAPSRWEYGTGPVVSAWWQWCGFGRNAGSHDHAQNHRVSTNTTNTGSGNGSDQGGHGQTRTKTGRQRTACSYQRTRRGACRSSHRVAGH